MQVLSIVVTAWRQVLARARADWLILSAAVVTILLATTLVAAGPIYAGAVTVSGLRRTLHDAPVRKANIQISVDTRAEQYQQRDTVATAVAQQGFALTGGTIERMARSSSFALPVQPSDVVRNLAVFDYYQNVQQHAHLLSGAWPAGGGDAVEAALPRAAADALNLGVGSTFDLTNRLQETLVIPVRISGIYEINSQTDPYWWEDPLALGGIDVGQSFTTYGPFVVDRADFFGALSAPGARFNWRVYPAFARVQVAMVGPLLANVRGLPGLLNQQYAANDQFSVDTGLDAILQQAQRSLLVTRTGVLVVTVQLAILAGYALLLTANLLVDRRRIETGLLHSRGASSGQIVALALMEALLLAIPAAIAGPWIAAFSLRVLNHAGPLAGIGLPLAPRVNQDAYLLSALAALGCVLALTFPSFQAARSFVQARQARGRQGAQGLAQRAGLDLILVAAAALGYWQLRRYGAPITQTVQGRLGLDPLLVAAPAIGLLAGAVLALRIIPLLARVIDRAAGRGRGLVSALGAWQVARRPLGYARAALLLMLAIAIGLFAMAYSATWSLSQRDQADYQVGADIRVQPDIRSGIAIPSMNLPAAQRRIPGVEATLPVTRDFLSVSRSTRSGALLGIDSAGAPRVVAFRSDLAMEPFDRMMHDLEAGRPAPPAIALPGSPQRLALDLHLTLDPLPEDTRPPRGGSIDIAPYLSVVVRDGRGLLHEIGPIRLASDDSTQHLVLPLAVPLASGAPGVPEYPLGIVGLKLTVHPLAGITRDGEIDLANLRVSDTLDGKDWTLVSLTPDVVAWSIDQYGLSPGAVVEPITAPQAGGLRARFSTGAQRGNGFASADFWVKPAGAPVPDALPALASQSFLSSTAAVVGDTLRVDLAGARRDVHIVGSFSGFPTIAPDVPSLVVDLPTLAYLAFQSDGRVIEPAEWWIGATPGQRAAVAQALSAPPYSSPKVFSRTERGTTLLTDPVALGIIGALSLGFVAAGMFAALGFAVSAAVSAWDRLTEFALLRALGLSPRQLSGWLSLENGLLVVVSLACGTGLGLLLAWLILPLVSLTQAASQTVPGVIVVVPWRWVLLLEAVSLAALALAIGVMAALLRRVGLGSTLRLGGE